MPHHSALFPVAMGSLRLRVWKQEAENRWLADAILTGHRQVGSYSGRARPGGRPSRPHKERRRSWWPC